MPSTTTNYGLHTFNTTTDKTQAFELFRDYLAGVGTNSNMYIIDGKLKEWKDLIDTLTARQGVIRVPMQYDGTNHYSASGITGISVAYTTGMAIVVIPDTTNDGTTQVNINSLGNLTLVKVDSAGVVSNLAAGDLVINHQYLFVYDGTNLVWITPNSIDQIHATGTVGNFITINADNNLGDSGLALDDDPLLSSDSDTLIPSQKAVKAYADAIIPNANALMYKGVIDCSTNPDYPAASAGWLYVVSVAGKIGGASGITVEAGDMALCKTDDTPSGDQATVGEFWNVVQRNIDGAVVNSGTGTSEAVAVFDGATGKIIKDGAAPGASGNILTSDGTSWISATSNGWIPVSDTWTYASANTVTIPSDGTTVYQKGDKFRLKQGGGYKEFYCVAIAATLITLTGGTDFTVANAAITDIAYSRLEKPFGFSNWKNCAAPVYDTATIDNGTGGVQPETTETLFRIDGDSVKLKTRLALTNVLKNGAGIIINFTIPLTLPNIIDDIYGVLGVVSIGNLNYAATAIKSTTATTVSIVSSTSIDDNASIISTSLFAEYRF